MLTRRMFNSIGLRAFEVCATSYFWALSPASAAVIDTSYEVTKSVEEWRRILTPAQFEVLRQHGTEYPGTSSLLNEHRKGNFLCAACDLPVFASETKFESGTGWPSFWAPIDGAVGTSEDRSYGMLRTEVHCRRCGSHLGHVFDDGPQPTGKRYCINGIAVKFQAKVS